jgi:queuine tRNA-ribosyltransferase
VGDAIAFEIHARSASTRARTGLVRTPHGDFRTPAFMPVGTRGSVKGIFPAHVRATGADILLNNTYHMMLRPGSALVARMGGVHRFMNWDGPILTDSGGYQAFSLADTNRVDDDGVTFKSIVDGSMIRMAPEDAMRIQNELGADIIMAFDDCPPPVGEKAVATEGASDPAQRGRVSAAIRRDGVGTAIDHAKRLDIANERTVRWLERCKASHARPHEQALFGIVQGGTDPDRRRWSAERITNIDLPGYAIGGVAVGETSADIARVVAFTAPLLPEAKPRYLMGVGYERDIVAAVRAGVDMFDCVLPTRNGRNANAFTPTGQVRLRNAKFAEDSRPIDPTCDCPACVPAPSGGVFSRGYLRHLFMAGEMLGPILVSLHNLRHFQRLMTDLRSTIVSDDWAGLAARWPVIVGESSPEPA